MNAMMEEHNGEHDTLPGGLWNVDTLCESLSCGETKGHTHSSDQCYNTCWCDLSNLAEVQDRRRLFGSI